MSENLPLHVTAEMRVQQDAPLINGSFDITNIYNKHATVEHALQTAQHIEPDSIVFLEGSHFSYERLPKSGLEAATTALAAQRLQFGKNHPAYQRNKQYLLEDLDNMLAVLPPGDPLFSEHIYGIRRKLVAKDCAVLVADADLSIIPDDQQDMSFLETHDRVYKHFGITDDILLGPGSAKSRFLDSVTVVRQFYAMQQARESFSVFAVATWLRGLAESDWLAKDLAMTELHMHRAYTVWGTSHAGSLTSQYLQLGIDVRQKVVDEQVETRDFVPVRSANLKEHARKRVLADAAAMAIGMSGHFLNPPAEGTELMDEIQSTNPETTFRNYIGLDCLIRQMRDLRVEYKTAMQYAVPRDDTDADYAAGALNIWKAVKEIGVAAEEYMYHPYLGYIGPTDKE